MNSLHLIKLGLMLSFSFLKFFIHPFEFEKNIRFSNFFTLWTFHHLPLRAFILFQHKASLLQA